MKLSHHFLFNGKKVIPMRTKKLQKYIQKQFSIETVIEKVKTDHKQYRIG